jgi:hypothetical protein
MPLTAPGITARKTAAAAGAVATEPREEHDFDVQGLVGIRLIGASPRNVAAVARQLGLNPTALNRAPDVAIRFVPKFELGNEREPDLRFIGADAGYSQNRFFILRGKHKAPAKMLFPMADIGGRCEIVCEQEMAAVPLLIAVVNLTMLAKGVLPMHASAFQLGETGVLATGWAKGGKTEVLLGFAQRGGEYVGDEWVYIGQRGERMFGLAEPIRIWDWHLAALPDYRRALSFADRVRLRGLAALTGVLESVARVGSGRSSWRRQIQRLSGLVTRQRYVQVPPTKLFERRASTLSARFELLLFVVSTDSTETRVRPIAVEEVARRMVFSLEEERRELLSYYRKFRFAFPNQRNLILEDASEIEQELATRFFAGKSAYLVEHPYPVPIDRVCDAICAAVEELPTPFKSVNP